MGSWRRLGNSGGRMGDPRNLTPEVMREQQESIERAARDSELRREAESRPGLSRWKRFWYWLRP